MPEQQKSTDWTPPVVGLPQSVPEGLILIHNHQPHTVDHPIGGSLLTGFTAWYDLIPESSNARFEKCECGWSGLPHCKVVHVGTGQCIPGTYAELKAKHEAAAAKV